MRVAAGVEYDGSDFHGWQRQADVSSVQEQVEQALSRVANHRVTVSCAGRTDTGVHATAQVIHFDSDAPRSLRSWVLGANVNLPPSICLLWARSVPDTFHARFSARSRSYRYTISNRPSRPALGYHELTWERRPLDVERMNAGAVQLLGEHDFSSFRALGCQAKSPVRTLHALRVERSGDRVILDVRANGFLHHMVRNLAGVLMAVGCGAREPAWVAEVLARRDRTRGGVTAPAAGLCFVGVEYPPAFGLPCPDYKESSATATIERNSATSAR
jgi:tRNA pseudouridine38-40 synthase